jgi:outer membrane protein OmpA-like peptidoglycan-associated protein
VLCVVAATGISALSACQQHVQAPPLHAAAPPPPPPEPPPPPSADDQLQAQLTQLDAARANHGWTLSLDSARYEGQKVVFDAGDAAHLARIIDLMKRSPNLRLQIEAFPGTHGSKSHRQELAQMHADSVLRELMHQGADEARMQAFAASATPPAGPQGQQPKQDAVNIIFSNAEGEFTPS